MNRRLVFLNNKKKKQRVKSVKTYVHNEYVKISVHRYIILRYIVYVNVCVKIYVNIKKKRVKWQNLNNKSHRPL